MIPDPGALKAAAAALAQEAVVAVARAGRGANSQVFRVECAHRVLALKVYPDHRDTRDRLNTEWNALSFLRRGGIDSVPIPIARDREQRLMMMEWLEGDPVTVHRNADLDDAISFMVKVISLTVQDTEAQFGLASEACLSAAEIIRQIDSRIDSLSAHPLLNRFLQERFLAAYDEAKRSLAGELAAPRFLAAELRKLIPADFGFHNAVRDSAGKLRYIDFDYFGWDDPVKLTADFILHPAMTLSSHDRSKVRAAIAAALPDDVDFFSRLERHLSLYTLRWALILLNPFRRDRTHMMMGDSARDVLLAERLQKADAMLAWSSELG